MRLRACAKTYFVVYSIVQINDEATIRSWLKTCVAAAVRDIRYQMCSFSIDFSLWQHFVQASAWLGWSLFEIQAPTLFNRADQTNMFNYTSCKLAAKYSRPKVSGLWSQHYQVIKLPTKTFNTRTGRWMYNVQCIWGKESETANQNCLDCRLVAGRRVVLQVLLNSDNKDKLNWLRSKFGNFAI